MAHDKQAPAAPRHKLVGLPPTVVSPADLGRLIRELEQIDNHLLELQLRKAGSDVALPKTSHLMEITLELNKLNLLQNADRLQLKQLLNLAKERAPVVHMSFSADPSPAFLEKVVVWLRREIHPLVLVTVGLQPNMGAGCMIRTTNKQFDLSLRQDFADKHELLLAKISAGDVVT